MSQWRVVDLSSFTGEATYRRGNLHLLEDDRELGVVPLAETAVLLIGLNVRLGGAVLQRCSAFDVVVLPCDWNGVPTGAVNSWSTHTRAGARQIAQANLTLPRRKNAWGRIVRAKIIGQATTMSVFDLDESERLIAMAKRVKSGDPDNLEAQAARRYWPRLFPDEVFVRDPGLGDNRNTLLNYGYTIMRGFAVRAITAAGLHPALGVFHRGRSNAFNLADDLMEPFRPALDATVALMSPSASLHDRGTKQALVSAADGVFSEAGHTISSELMNLAQQFGRYAEGDIDRLPVPEWQGGFFVSW